MDSQELVIMYVSIMGNNVEEFKQILERQKHQINECMAFWPSPAAVACQLGHIKCVKLLMEKGADLTFKTDGNNTLLHIAAEGGYIEIIKLLIDQSLDINAENIRNQTPLHFAVLKSRYSIIKLLISSGCNVNIVSSDFDIHRREKVQTTPLGVACFNSNIRVCRLLLEAGGDINPPLAENFTPMHVACTNDNVKLVRYLIEANADVNACDHKGRTPLHVAVEYECYKLLKSLLTHPTAIDVNRQNLLGMTPLHMACKKNINMVRLFLDHGAATDIKDAKGSTAIYTAIENSKEDIALALLDHGVGVDFTTVAYRTPLHCACRRGSSLKIVQSLLERADNINCVTKKRKNALHLAAVHSKKEVISLLISEIGDIDAKDKHDRTALHHACKRGNLEIVQLLVEAGASVDVINDKRETPLHSAVLNGSIPVATYLVKSGAPINAVDINDNTPLHLAIREKSKYMVSMLIRHGADINKPENVYGQTALHVACKLNQFSVARKLIRHGADVCAKMKDGVTPLHLIAMKGDIGTAKALLAEGAYLDAPLNENNPLGPLSPANFLRERVTNKGVRWYIRQQEKLFFSIEVSDFHNVRYYLVHDVLTECRSFQYRTPLIHSIKKKNLSIAMIMLEYGADVGFADEENTTPLHYAAKYGQLSIVYCLLRFGAVYNAVNLHGKTPLDMAEEANSAEIIHVLKTVGAIFNKVSNEGGGCKDVFKIIQDNDFCKCIPSFLAAKNENLQTVPEIINNVLK